MRFLRRVFIRLLLEANPAPLFAPGDFGESRTL
jgi:hypothetical protein